MSTYPARCVVKLERRTVPGEDGACAIRELEDVIASAREEDPDLVASVRMLLERAPSELGSDHELVAVVAKSAEELLATRSDPIGVAYWMDMALLNAAGIPTVAFGPTGAGEHADVEWVDLASLELCVLTYLKTASDVCGRHAT